MGASFLLCRLTMDNAQQELCALVGWFHVWTTKE